MISKNKTELQGMVKEEERTSKQVTRTQKYIDEMRSKVWVKPKAEMSFLYGNHVQRAQLSKITQNTPQDDPEGFNLVVVDQAIKGNFACRISHQL